MDGPRLRDALRTSSPFHVEHDKDRTRGSVPSPHLAIRVPPSRVPRGTQSQKFAATWPTMRTASRPSSGSTWNTKRPSLHGWTQAPRCLEDLLTRSTWNTTRTALEAPRHLHIWRFECLLHVFHVELRAGGSRPSGPLHGLAQVPRGTRSCRHFMVRLFHRANLKTSSRFHVEHDTAHVRGSVPHPPVVLRSSRRMRHEELHRQKLDAARGALKTPSRPCAGSTWNTTRTAFEAPRGLSMWRAEDPFTCSTWNAPPRGLMPRGALRRLLRGLPQVPRGTRSGHHLVLNSRSRDALKTSSRFHVERGGCRRPRLIAITT
ncbi:hypothetical protein WA016_03604 [Myxococcus stipitatus]